MGTAGFSKVLINFYQRTRCHLSFHVDLKSPTLDYVRSRRIFPGSDLYVLCMKSMELTLRWKSCLYSFAWVVYVGSLLAAVYGDSCSVTLIFNSKK